MIVIVSSPIEFTVVFPGEESYACDQRQSVDEHHVVLEVQFWSAANKKETYIQSHSLKSRWEWRLDSGKLNFHTEQGGYGGK